MEFSSSVQQQRRRTYGELSASSSFYLLSLLLLLSLLVGLNEAKVSGNFEVTSLSTSLNDCNAAEAFADDSQQAISGSLFVSRTKVHMLSSSKLNDHRSFSRDLKLEESSPITRGFGLLQDFSTSSLFLLADSQLRPIKWNSIADVVTHLLPLDPLTGDPLPSSALPLSDSILLNDTLYVVLLSGYGEAMILSEGFSQGEATLINLATGAVTVVSSVFYSNIQFSTCGQYGSWYSYGILEKIAPNTYNALTATKKIIYRHDLKADKSNLVSNFTGNGPNNMCSLFLSLSSSKWYWSNTFSDDFSPASLGVGYCDLSFSASNDGSNLFSATLTLNNCEGVDVYDYIGENGGLVYPSSSQVFVNGHSTRVTLTPQLVPTSPPLSFPALAVVTDYRSGKIYCLASRFGVCISSFATIAYKLAELNSATGKPTGVTINLSSTILVRNFVRNIIASGYGEVLYYDEISLTAYLIDFTSGAVVTEGSITIDSVNQGYYINICESPYIFGALEKNSDGTRTVLISTSPFDSTGTTIVRWDYQADTASAFFKLGKLEFAALCSFHLAPSANRWYFTFEGIDPILGGGIGTNIGYCDASYVTNDGFSVSSLTVTNCLAQSAEGQVGDEFGPVYVSSSNVFLLGNSGLGTFDYSLKPVTKSMVGVLQVISDLRTGSAYTLLSESRSYLQQSGEMHFLERFDPETQIPISTIALSTPIQVNSDSSCQTLFFQGFGEFGMVDSSNPSSMVVVEFANGNVTTIPLPNGLSNYNPQCCNSILTLGVLERVGDVRTILYPVGAGEESLSIVRFDLNTGDVASTFAFDSPLGVICSFTLSISTDRWYWTFSQRSTLHNTLLAGGNTVTVGSCSAETSVVLPPSTPPSPPPTPKQTPKQTPNPTPTPKTSPAEEKTYTGEDGEEVKVDICPDPELPYGCKGECVNDLRLCLPKGDDACINPEDCAPKSDIGSEDIKVLPLDTVVTEEDKPLQINAVESKGQYIAEIEILPGTFKKGTVISVRSFKGEFPEDENKKLKRFSAVFNIEAFGADGKKAKFKKPVTISLLAVLPDNKDPSDVCIGFNHGTADSKWQCEDDKKKDKDDNGKKEKKRTSHKRVKGQENSYIITEEFDHFTGFAVLLGSAPNSISDFGAIEWLSFAFLIAGGMLVILVSTVYYFYHKRKTERVRQSLVRLASPSSASSLRGSMSSLSDSSESLNSQH